MPVHFHSVHCTRLSIKKCQKSVWKFWERFFGGTNFSNYRLWSICCRNDLGESNATISLNFDSKFTNSIKTNGLEIFYKKKLQSMCVWRNMICKKEKYMICKKSKKDLKLGKVRDQSRAPNLSCHTVSKFKENIKKLLGESELRCTVRILYWLD